MARPRFIALLLALVTVVAFLPLRQATFINFDDPDYVTENSIVQAGITTVGIKWAFTASHSSNWHPLTWLSHMVDCELFGLNAGAQHLVNVLFHAANAVLVFVLLFRATEKLWPSAFVAALFAWHPLHVESVAWISERKDVLSTFFGLLSLLFYAQWAKAKANNKDSRKKHVPFAALLFFALGLLAKPMLVTLPFLMLLMDFWPLRRLSGTTPSATKSGETHSLKSLLLEKAPFFALTVGSCIVTYFAQRHEAVVSLEKYPSEMRLENSVIAYALYLAKMIWPANLAILYPLPPEIPFVHVAIAAAILVTISIFVWVLRKRHPYLLVGWLWFVGMLVPVIGLVQVGAQSMADRYTYLPLLGIFIAIAFGAQDLASRFNIKPAVLTAVAIPIIAAMLFLTERQIGYWQNSEILFRHALDVTTNNAVAHTNLGVALEHQGRREEALAEYRNALEINPRLVALHNNIGNLLDETGHREEAGAEYREALRLKPDAPLAHVNYGTYLDEVGRFDEAMQEYAKAAQLAPNDSRPHYLMGKACLHHGQSTEAVAHFREALRIDPNDLQSITWLGRVLASDENPAVRNSAEAVTLAERANDMSGGEQPFVLDTLAMAYSEAGRFADAQRTGEQAVQLAGTADAKTTETLRQHLASYQASQPIRENFQQTEEEKKLR